MPRPAPLLLLLLAALRAVAPESINTTAPATSDELLVTAAFGGAAGDAGAAALAELAAGLLRQHGARAAVVPPPAACRAADSLACRNAALRALRSRRLHVALLPLAPGAAPPRWLLRDAGLELLAAWAAPARRSCRAPRPPARSLLDLAAPRVAAAYPAPRGLPPPAARGARCGAERCAALLVADAAEAAALAPALRQHDLLLEVFAVGAALAQYAALPLAEAPLICDFAVEAALPAAAGWAQLGPPPCAGGGEGEGAEGAGCAFESRELALLGDMRALARAPRALCALLRLRLEAAALRALLRAGGGARAAAAAQLAGGGGERCAAREVRVAALLPLTTQREVEPAGALLAAAQLAEEDEAAATAGTAGTVGTAGTAGTAGAAGAAPRFKVEVYDSACSSRRAYKYLLDALGTAEYGALAALAGPACGAAWADVARQSAAHALPLLGYRAAAGAGPLLLRAGGAARGPARALAAWLAARGWRRAALLAGGAGGAGAGGAGGGLAATLPVHTQLPDAPHVDYALIEQWAERAAAADARVLAVWSDDAREVRAALCAAWRRRLRPNHGAVLLLPPGAAGAVPLPPGDAARRAAGNDSCRAQDLAEMLDGHFTVAPAWQAAWEQWDAPSAANLSGDAAAAWRTRLQRHCQLWQEAGGPGGAAGAGCAPAAAAGALYDALRLWARALRRLHAARPAALDDLHDPAVARELVELATAAEYRGVTGTITWERDPAGGWSRAGGQVVAQWCAGDRAPREVAAWRDGRLADRPAALRWRTPDGRQPADGGAACGVAALAAALGAGCGAAWALLGAGGGAALLAALAAAAGWRRRAERSFRRRLAALGPRAPPAPDRWELPRARVVITRRLGTGAFGTVYAGHALLARGWCAVAVKTLKPGASTEEKLDFLAEAEAMKRLEHENVVRLLGVVTQSEPVCTVMEFMPLGDLKSYLLAMRAGGGGRDAAGAARRLTALARDAARALSYLALQRWVHGDVAARNCLVAARGLKLADFGLARRVFDADYYRCSRRGLLPVRWMAPEALRGALSPASDVWALGALLLEMASLGAAPFAGLSTAAVLARLRRARPPDPPPGLQPQLEALMRACWAAAPRARPAAAEVAALLAECPRLVTPAPLYWAASEGPASAGTDTTYLSSSAARETDRFLSDDVDTEHFQPEDVDTDHFQPEDVDTDHFLTDDVDARDADSAGSDWLADM